MRIFSLLLILIIYSGHTCSRTFDLCLEAEAGYQTNVYDAADLTYKNKPLVTYLLNPRYLRDMGEMWRCEVDAGLTQDIFIGANDNLSVESGVDLARIWNRNKTIFGLSGGYYSQPGLLDPAQPLKNTMYNFSASHKHGFRVPVKGAYSLLVMDELKSARLDYKNKLNVKIYFKYAPWIRISPGAGAAWNRSNYREYNYIELSLSLSNSLIFKLIFKFSCKNLFLQQPAT